MLLFMNCMFVVFWVGISQHFVFLLMIYYFKLGCIVCSASNWTSGQGDFWGETEENGRTFAVFRVLSSSQGQQDSSVCQWTYYLQKLQKELEVNKASLNINT